MKTLFRLVLIALLAAPVTQVVAQDTMGAAQATAFNAAVINAVQDINTARTQAAMDEGIQDLVTSLSAFLRGNDMSIEAAGEELASMAANDSALAAISQAVMLVALRLSDEDEVAVASDVVAALQRGARNVAPGSQVNRSAINTVVGSGAYAGLGAADVGGAVRGSVASVISNATGVVAPSTGGVTVVTGGAPGTTTFVGDAAASSGAASIDPDIVSGSPNL